MRSLATSDRLGLNRYISQQINYSLLERSAENELLPLGIHEGVRRSNLGSAVLGLSDGEIPQPRQLWPDPIRRR